MKFVPGQTYSTRSICNHDCIYSFKVISRTDKSVMVQDLSNMTPHPQRKGLKVHAGVEYFKPHGSYSMAAIIGADDKDLTAS